MPSNSSRLLVRRRPARAVDARAADRVAQRAPAKDRAPGRVAARRRRRAKAAGRAVDRAPVGRVAAVADAARLLRPRLHATHKVA